MTLTRRSGGSKTTKAKGRPAPKSLSDIAQQTEVQLALDNDAFLRVAENIVYLRRYRNLSQAGLARKMQTSQAAVARIEGASENVTLRTIEKAVEALKGRLHLSVSPEEVHLPTMPNWWDLLSLRIESIAPLTCTFIMKDEVGSPVRVAAGWVGTVPKATRAIGPMTVETVTSGSAFPSPQARLAKFA